MLKKSFLDVSVSFAKEEILKNKNQLDQFQLNKLNDLIKHAHALTLIF